MSNIADRLNHVLKVLDKKNISKVAYDSFKNNTPVGDPNRWKSKRAPRGYRPGNARRSTVLKSNTIEANYPYAQRLEEGWSSQAPNGMTEPTIEDIREYVFKQTGVRM